MSTDNGEPAAQYDPDMFTKMMRFTSIYHRDMYPALEAAQSSGSGKFVLITGASKGIGRATAIAWARAGAAGIAICSRSKATLDPVADELKSISPATNVLAVPCDTTKPADVAHLFDQTKEQFGRLDVVVANVGSVVLGKIGEQDEELWWDEVTRNLRSAHLTAHHYIRAFGADVEGTFIGLSSGAGSVIIPSMSSYGISKQAIYRLVEYIDAEYPNLKAFSLDPGIVPSDMTLDMLRPFAHDAQELPGAVNVWLASGRADACRGGYVHATWDIEEIEKNSTEIKERQLLKPASKFLNGILGQPNGAFGE